MPLSLSGEQDMQKRHHNVLIFDSGVGGISVYQEIKAKLPYLNYIYLFDNEAYPYGELPQEKLLQRVMALVSKIVEQEKIDLVVIACNTASTIVLPTLRTHLSIPVVGVVPAIKTASQLASKAIGLIATPATITRQYTQDLIREFSSNTKVELLGSTRLVDMAEEKLRGKPVDLIELESILEPLINKIDVAVLGCTHFPLIKNEIQKILNNVLLIDSGKAIARRVQDLLEVTEEINESKDEIKMHKILSSAAPWEECALNSRLSYLGFSPVQIYRHQDV